MSNSRPMLRRCVRIKTNFSKNAHIVNNYAAVYSTAMDNETPPSAEQPAAAGEAINETPEFCAWRERDRLFWRRHQEVLRLRGVLGLGISVKPQPITIILDDTADLPRVRQQVRALFADMGLTLGDLCFEQRDPPPAIGRHPLDLLRASMPEQSKEIPAEPVTKDETCAHDRE